MRIVFTIIGVFLASAAFAAGADDYVISFFTNGPDRYADGTQVLDGECYALVWSADGVFEGFAADATPLGEGDKVVLIAPVAKDGRCPDILFQIPYREATANSGGKYDVFLLDTRLKSGDSLKCAGMEGGKVKLLNGYTEVSAVLKSDDASGLSAITPTGAESGLVVSTLAAAPDGSEQPRIKDMRIQGGNVYLTVENLGGFMRVQGGGDIRAADVTGVAQQADGDEDVILVAPKLGGSGFYRVIRN